MVANYKEYLKELKSTTLFQGIDDDALIALLQAISPEIVHVEENGEMPMMSNGFKEFAVFLRGYPQKDIENRRFKYDMPKFGEPGMMMGEIPSLSEMNNTDRPMKRMPFPKGKGPHGGARPAMDILMFSGESVTKFYNMDVSAAQSHMLRNFLGILAQKVTDIRHDLFIAKDNFDMYGETDKTLNIFTAGCAMGLAKDLADIWTNRHPELPAVVTPGGSVDLVRKVAAGEPCDVIISADDLLIKDMLLPAYAGGYTVFAGNRMVLVPTGDKEITSDNWKEILLKDDTTFAHHNPYGDPGGYRAVMSILLADNYEKGLSAKLMNHRGHIGMDKNATGRPTADFMFGYESGPKSQGKPYATLPDVMNLGNDALADLYAKVSFAVDDNNTVVATPIAHGVTVPFAALHPSAAHEFVDMLLDTDIEKYGFIARHKDVGKY